jgi:hypothetical protein
MCCATVGEMVRDEVLLSAGSVAPTSVGQVDNVKAGTTCVQVEVKAKDNRSVLKQQRELQLATCH